MDRRDFLKLLSAASAASNFGPAEELFAAPHPSGNYRPGRIMNEYSAFLPGEQTLGVVGGDQQYAATDSGAALAAVLGRERSRCLPSAKGGGEALVPQGRTHRGMPMPDALWNDCVDNRGHQRQQLACGHGGCLGLQGDAHLHIHAPAGGSLRSASTATVEGSAAVVPAAAFAKGGHVELA